MAGLIFADAEKAKLAIMDSQKKEIADLYNKWADEVHTTSLKYSFKSMSAPSYGLAEQQLKQLEGMMRAQSQQLSNELYGLVKSNIYTVAEAVVNNNASWMSGFGFSEKGLSAAFNYVPDQTVQMLITGQIYEGGWNLSSAIWGDNEKTLRDIYGLVARGRAENLSTYEIAKSLEQYVRPEAKLPWNLMMGDGRKIYKRQVDYNAQRLARTLVQHGYQQSFIAVTKDNPFVLEYMWIANGSRACPLCHDRDGQTYKKDELPMDHPNGMCTMEPVISDKLVDQLADWFNAEDGTYPEIDEFANKISGYTPTPKEKIDTVEKFLAKYGQSEKSPDAWYKSLTSEQKAEAKALKDQSGLTWNEWYNQNVLKKPEPVSPVVTLTPEQAFVQKWGGSTKSPSAWYNSLSAEQKAEAKALKEASGLTWNDWYNKYVFSCGTPAPTGETVKAFSELQQKYMAPYGFTKDKMPASFTEWASALPNSEKGKILNSMGLDWSTPHPYQQLEKWYNANMTSANFIDKPAPKPVASTFDPSLYTAKAKREAHKFSNRNEADRAFFRPQLDAQWNNLTKQEHYGVWEYTHNSNPMNKPLSGYGQSWDRSSFVGPLKSNWGTEDSWRNIEISAFKEFAKKGTTSNVDYHETISALTRAIDKTVMQEGVHLVRGSDNSGLAGLFEGDIASFDQVRSMLNRGDIDGLNALFKGQVVRNDAFTSTGIASDAGFSGDVKYRIYAPAGTKAIYAEPQSYFGDTSSRKEYVPGASYHGVGGEAEVILQRGTEFRITEIKESGSKLIIDMEVVNQPDYFKYGDENTADGGATRHK